MRRPSANVVEGLFHFLGVHQTDQTDRTDLMRLIGLIGLIKLRYR